MEIKSDINPITITDEHPASSYGIPVVVYNDTAYGDSDAIDGPLTGRQAKIDVATRCARLETIDANTFDWIIKGTGHMTHAEYLDHLAAERKSGGLFFGK